MGFFSKFVENKKKEFKDNAEFNAKVRAKVKVARREAFEKQAIISAKESAKKKAALKFNPPAQKAGISHSGQSDAFKRLAFGSAAEGNNKAMLQRKIIKRSAKGTRKRVPMARKRINKTIKKAANNDFNRLMYGEHS